MSRIGKKPIAVPSGVEVTIDGQHVSVKGPKGTLSHTVAEPITVTRGEDGQLEVARPNDERRNRSLHGLTRTLVSNMIEGVTKGYEKKLDIVGVGWNAQVRGQVLALNIGFANTIEMPIPMGVNVEAKGQNITISGADKQAVGNFASSVRMKRKPEPYNGKGIRYAGEQITRKQGKAFGS